MLNLNSYLQNNGYDINMELSNERYSIYDEVGVVDNKMDTISYNNEKLKIVNFIMKFEGLNYYIAKKKIDNFILLVDPIISDKPYVVIDVKSENEKLWNQIDSLKSHIANLESFITMGYINDNTNGANGSWYLENTNIEVQFYRGDLYNAAMNDALSFDKQNATMEELMIIPQIADIRKKIYNDEALKTAASRYHQVNKIYKKLKK